MKSFRRSSRSPPYKRYRTGHRHDKNGRRDHERAAPSCRRHSNGERSPKMISGGRNAARKVHDSDFNHHSSSTLSRYYSKPPNPKKRKLEPAGSHLKLTSNTAKRDDFMARDSDPDTQPSEIHNYTCLTLPKLYYTKDGTPVADTTDALHSRFSEKLLRNIPAKYTRLAALAEDSDAKDESDLPHPEQGSVSTGCSLELAGEAADDQLVTASTSTQGPPNAVCIESQPCTDSMNTALGRESQISGEPMEVELYSPLSTKTRIHDRLPLNIPSKGGSLPTFQLCEDDHAHLEKSAPLLQSYHCYSLEFLPNINFKFKTGTVITNAEGKEYNFEGFLMLSATSLEHVPCCRFHRYGGSYQITFKEQPLPHGLTMTDLSGLLLFEDYVFVGLLELYDWMNDLKVCARELLFLPCFSRRKASEDYEILSVAEVLDFLLQSYVPLKDIFSVKKRDVSRYEAYGLLVSNPEKTPACVRVDRLEFEDTKSKRSKIIHFCSEISHTDQTSEKELATDQATLQRKLSRGKLKQKEFYELKELKQKTKRGRNLHTEHTKEIIEFESDGFFSTGLYFDIVQHALVLPLVASHVTFHKLLTTLEEKLVYRFKDRQLLQRSLTHPSMTGCPYYGTNEHHARNALSNCGVKYPKRLRFPSSSIQTHQNSLIEALERGVDESIRLQNNEQLEFLGDAVLEFSCSLRLFKMFPSDTVGQLTSYRRCLVKNKHLSEVAATINLKSFIRKNTKMDLPEESFMRLAANCLEAIFGAVFLDSGLEETEKLIARLFFQDENVFQVWMKDRVQPLQLRNEHGDRELVEKEELLQRMLPLEESVGVKFTNISLLAQAFTHSSVVDTEVTMGNYQRMEYLGDAILQFLTSHYVYVHFPSQHEGHLSMLRTSLVHNKQLSKLCKQLGFYQFIITSKTENLLLTGKILADVIESFLAALYLDKGLKYAKCFLETTLFPKLEDVIRNSELVDASVHLQQAVVYTCKRRNIGMEFPIYRTLNVQGPPNKPDYTVAVYFKEKRLGKGNAQSIREARKKAAENALSRSNTYACDLILPPLLQKMQY